jgi:hypothetical protein
MIPKVAARRLMLWHLHVIGKVVLCLFQGCVGISIVWSAFVGFLAVTYRPLLPHTTASPSVRLLLRSSALLSVTVAVVFWGFYAATEDAITSVAHAAAFVLGALIGWLWIRAVLRGETSSPPSPETDPIIQGTIAEDAVR